MVLDFVLWLILKNKYFQLKWLVCKFVQEEVEFLCFVSKIFRIKREGMGRRERKVEKKRKKGEKKEEKIKEKKKF